MQSQSNSKSIKQGGQVSSTRSKQITSERQGSSRTRNTSGGDSGGGHNPIHIELEVRPGEKKDVTPKALMPLNPSKDPKSGEDAAKDGAVGEDGAPAEGRKDGEDMPPVPLPPPPAERGKPPKPPGLSKDELDRCVDIVLSETETDTLLVYPSLCVALDDPTHQKVSERIKAYDELCQSKADSDQYKEQHCQTLNHPHKMKEVLAAPPSTDSVEVNANPWDIYDTFAFEAPPKHEQIQQACEKESAAAVAQAIKKPGCLFDMSMPYPQEVPVQQPPTGGKASSKARGGAAKSSGGLRGGASRPLGAGPTSDSLTQAQSSALVDDPERTAAPAAIADAAAAAAAEERGDEDEAGKVGDPIPWKVGAGNPIPEELSNGLRVMERIVSQNVFHKQHMIYRNYPTLEELAKLDELRADEALGSAEALENGGGTGRRSNVASSAGDGAPGGAPGGGNDGGPGDEEEAAEGRDVAEADEGGSRGDEADKATDRGDKPWLQDLFAFEAPQLTQGLTVTCAEWNRHNQDLLAVSYGDTAPVPNTPGGLVLFWSLKNPTYPERVIRTKSGVTALHFSSVHPNHVSAGTHDGSVLIWDLRRPGDAPVLRSGASTSTHNDQKHTDIVWETRWVERGPDKQPPEMLVSVSSDGQVLQWSMKKGLEQTLLMQLKRVPNPNLGSNSVYGHKEALVFRKSSGLCVDFPLHNPATYLVGTEDGLVHQCSTSYTEQYLGTPFLGHSGPVYKVRCNPFESHAFLTCSADWQINLWSTRSIPGHAQDTPLDCLRSPDLTDGVNDVYWSPRNSTSFAAAMDDGRVELWDLTEKRLDPVVVHYPREAQGRRPRTCVRFSPNSPVLVAGDDRGCIDVMRMYNTEVAFMSVQEQKDRLNAVMVKKR